MPATKTKRFSAMPTTSMRDGGCKSIGKAAPKTRRQSVLPATSHLIFSSTPPFISATTIRAAFSATSFSLTPFTSGAEKKEATPVLQNERRDACPEHHKSNSDRSFYNGDRKL